MNENNLIRFDQMSPERHRELSRRGGAASGKRRRKKAEEKRLRLDSSIEFLKKCHGILCDEQTEAEFREFIRWRRKKQQ